MRNIIVIVSIQKHKTNIVLGNFLGHMRFSTNSEGIRQNWIFKIRPNYMYFCTCPFN